MVRWHCPLGHVGPAIKVRPTVTMEMQHRRHVPNQRSSQPPPPPLPPPPHPIDRMCKPVQLIQQQSVCEEDHILNAPPSSPPTKKKRKKERKKGKGEAEATGFIRFDKISRAKRKYSSGLLGPSPITITTHAPTEQFNQYRCLTLITSVCTRATSLLAHPPSPSY